MSLFERKPINQTILGRFAREYTAKYNAVRGIPVMKKSINQKNTKTVILYLK